MIGFDGWCRKETDRSIRWDAGHPDILAAVARATARGERGGRYPNASTDSFGTMAMRAVSGRWRGAFRGAGELGRHDRCDASGFGFEVEQAAEAGTAVSFGMQTSGPGDRNATPGALAALAERAAETRSDGRALRGVAEGSTSGDRGPTAMSAPFSCRRRGFQRRYHRAHQATPAGGAPAPTDAGGAGAQWPASRRSCRGQDRPAILPRRPPRVS